MLWIQNKLLKLVTGKMQKENSIRLPLDLLLVLDVEELENAMNCQYAIEHENEIEFCKTKDELDIIIEDYEDYDWYEIDEIEYDRINAVIDLLNKAEDDAILGHILDRVVR